MRPCNCLLQSSLSKQTNKKGSVVLDKINTYLILKIVVLFPEPSVKGETNNIVSNIEEHFLLSF